MTERLYYDDAYLWSFSAKVTAVFPAKKDGQWLVSLDRSAFYPTSGGQPFDTGRLIFPGGECSVLDVEADPSGEVWHLVDREVPAGAEIRGEIGVPRRLDHME